MKPDILILILLITLDPGELQSFLNIKISIRNVFAYKLFKTIVNFKFYCYVISSSFNWTFGLDRLTYKNIL